MLILLTFDCTPEVVRFERNLAAFELESEGGMRISKQNYIFVPFVSFYFLDFFRISSKIFLMYLLLKIFGKNQEKLKMI